MALTFDDCDDPESWSMILDVLDAEGVQAAFFPSGMRVIEYPALLRRTIADGHTVGSRGFDHSRLVGRSRSDLERLFQRDRRAWLGAAGITPVLFRPPYGAWDDLTWTFARRFGFQRLVLWDIDPEDWRLPPRESLIERVVGCARPGSTVLLHVMPETASALRTILADLRGRGLLPSTLVRGLVEPPHRRPMSSIHPPP